MMEPFSQSERERDRERERDTTGKDAFNWWKKSPPHNAIMLGAFTKIGIDSAQGYVAAVYA
jgi:uncharacterized protein YkwD